MNRKPFKFYDQMNKRSLFKVQDNKFGWNENINVDEMKPDVKLDRDENRESATKILSHHVSIWYIYIGTLSCINSVVLWVSSFHSLKKGKNI